MYKEIAKKYPNGFVHAIVAGHGGIENGKYQIIKKGSKQHTFPDGLTIYEGEQNRIIKNTTIELSKWDELNVIDPIPGNLDVPLPERVLILNKLFDNYKKEGKLLLVWEVHLNAFSNEKASGKEVFTTKGQNFSDEMATIWWNHAEKLIPEQKDRPDYSDGDPDKEVDYYLIKNIKTFGVLIEMLFFTNREEVSKYLNPNGYAKLAGTIVRSMLELDFKLRAELNKL